ncbi:MAG: hypothetical protein WKG01_15820 [Kofleriaceae bacterium]
MLILLPILTGAIGLHLDTHEALETELVAQVRADVKAGWGVVDGPGYDAGVSVVKDGLVMRRSIEPDDAGEGGQLTVAITPATSAPRISEFLTQAMTRGGVTLASSCGGWYLDPYVIEERARGAAAAALVSTTLRGADDLESASYEGSLVTVVLERDGSGLELTVEIDDENRIDRATVKRMQSATDTGTYKRKNRLRQALRGKTITTIDTSESAVVLVVGSKRFELDPDGDAFVPHPRDDDDSGCGC